VRTRTWVPWVGGGAYLLTAQYFVGEYVAAAGWRSPAYDFATNYISDLGVTTAPRHAVMNTSFVLLGVLNATGSVLLRGRLRPGRLRQAAVALMVTSGIGDVLVGLFPGSVESQATGTNLPHVVGAVLAIGAGNAGILAAGLALRPTHRRLAVYSMASGAFGLGAFALFGLGVDLGLGIGTVERLAADPVVIWMMLVGSLSLLRR